MQSPGPLNDQPTWGGRRFQIDHAISPSSTTMPVASSMQVYAVKRSDSEVGIRMMMVKIRGLLDTKFTKIACLPIAITTLN